MKLDRHERLRRFFDEKLFNVEYVEVKRNDETSFSKREWREGDENIFVLLTFRLSRNGKVQWFVSSLDVQS